jgi:hypothetical protein
MQVICPKQSLCITAGPLSFCRKSFGMPFCLVALQLFRSYKVNIGLHLFGIKLCLQAVSGLPQFLLRKRENLLTGCFEISSSEKLNGICQSQSQYSRIQIGLFPLHLWSVRPSHHPSNAWSIKCRLIACLSAQIRSNLWDESIKPN